MLALIDGDEFVYKVGYGSQHTYYEVYDAAEYPYNDPTEKFNSAKEAKEWLKDKEGYITVPKVEVLPLRTALRNVRMVLKSMLKEMGTEQYLLCFSSETNFRNEIALLEPYKSNRNPEGKPKLFNEIKEFLKRNFNWTSTEGYEADDLLAIYYNIHDTDKEGRAIIVSQDKDLSQVPGWHWNMGTKEHEKYGERGTKFFISEEEGLRNFYKQLLTGDATDTIPGLYKITGEKCSKQYLQSIDIWFDTKINLNLLDKNAYWNIVRPLYSRFIGEKFRYEYMEDLDCILFEIGNLLYMRRSFDDLGWRIPS